MLADVNEFEEALKGVTSGGAYSSQGMEGTASKGYSLALICPDPHEISGGKVSGGGGFGAYHQDRSGVQSLLSTIFNLSVAAPPPLTAGQTPSLVSPSQQGYIGGAFDSTKTNAMGVMVTSNNVDVSTTTVSGSSATSGGGGVSAMDQVMLVGMMDFEVLSKAIGGTGVPWAIHLSTLFQMIRKGSWTITHPYVPGGARSGDGDSPRYNRNLPTSAHTQMSPTSRGFLEISSKGPVPFQWQMELFPVVSKDRRLDLNSQLTKVLINHHTKVVGEYEREKKDRQEAEDVISRAYASGAPPELGKRSKDGAQTKPASKGGDKKPMSLLNPGQRSTVKRAKGVKIG